MYMDMPIKLNTAHLVRLGRNCLVHHKRTWLPYGVILLCLAGIWFCWDDYPSERQETIRETAKREDSQSPVFSALPQDTNQEAPSGDLVYGTAQTQRRRPLPDLFAGSLPKKAAVPAASSGAVLPKEHAPAAAASVVVVPSPCGIMRHGSQRLVFLRGRTQTKVCAVGDECDGFRVVYIHEQAVGLAKDGQILERAL